MAEPKKPTQYHLHYVADWYTVADAFRPEHRVGRRSFTVPADPARAWTDSQVIAAADQTAPEGYWLQRAEAIGGEPHVRELLRRPVPYRVKAAQGGEHG